MANYCSKKFELIWCYHEETKSLIKYLSLFVLKRYFCNSFNILSVKAGFIFTFLLLITLLGNAQTCTTLGQNPSSAFPVCGTNTFSQSTVPYCGGAPIPGPCSTDPLTDTNPFWYKFTCFSAGTLGFLITPDDLADDYDWQLFDITGKNPNDIYTDPSLFVACNWSGNTGLTGASASGTSLQNCAGPAYPTFSAMPTLKLDHNYLLLVSHFTVFTPSQKGYTLSFGGGTASITDPKLPDLQSATSSCDASKIYIKLNKKMRCSTLDPDGSDFVISSPLTNIISAIGSSCSNGFDMDSLILTLSNPLPPGNYTVTIKNGTDSNTIMDNCDRNIPPGNSLPLTIPVLMPTPMDSMVPVKCSPRSLQLVFKKNMLCNSIAPDGSDFMVTGPSPVSVINAGGNCVNGVTGIINVTLGSPIVKGGTYKIILKQGSDGNTILDECSQPTPAGSSINFMVTDTVSADFTYQLLAGCQTDTLQLFHNGNNGVNQWAWTLDYNGNSVVQNPVTYFSTFGQKQIILRVSNGVCSDTLSKIINLGNKLKADFETNNILCPEDSAEFINKSTGNVVSYYWNFDNGNTSFVEAPSPQKFPLLTFEKTYSIRLIVGNSGCADTSFQNIKVLKSCYIAVPTAFTPNGDGLNDFLYPLNAYKADNLEFKVYNRLGQLVFSSKEWTRKWDGTIKGEPQDSGIYVWTLQYTNRDTGKHIFMKGSTVLIR
ncbi:MAG: gliding motility-associated C-terminal domain-containing protein [Bacteroidota bacterium]|nr:gliding motility-associated C-terminal domain-containing protein [Bacteroidota bacterium]